MPIERERESGIWPAISKIKPSEIAATLATLITGIIDGICIYIRIHIRIDKNIKSINVNKKSREILQNVDRETAELLSSTAVKKSKSILDQFVEGKIFLRRKLFNEFWEDAVQSSNSYLSICDLSMYSGLSMHSGKGAIESERIESEKSDWRTRTENEIELLKKAEKVKEFDKIILFGSSQNDNNPIFDLVKQLWQDGVRQLRDSGKKSHYPGGGNSSMVWTCSREEFSSWMRVINGSTEIKGQINSNDLGIFGGHLIGEEFKVDEASTIKGEFDYDDFYDLKFIYRFKIQDKLVEKIKEKTIEKMKSGNIASIT